MHEEYLEMQYLFVTYMYLYSSFIITGIWFINQLLNKFHDIILKSYMKEFPLSFK